MTTLPHVLDRDLTIRAPRELVFAYFTDSERWASWWGAGSSIEARPGGVVRICYPNGVEAGGEVILIEPDHRLVFSFGYASGVPLPVGASRVELSLEDAPQGTRLLLRHFFEDGAARDQHVPGWRYQLAVFANLVAAAVASGMPEHLLLWCAAWSAPSREQLDATLARCTTKEVEFRDQWGCVVGRGELAEHILAVQRFFPGRSLEVDGPFLHTQGTVVFPWRVVASDGSVAAQGTNVVELAPDGRFRSVVGLAR